jgi:hypothetical protein
MNFTRHSHDGHPLELFASPVPGPISSGRWGAQVRQAAELGACPATDRALIGRPGLITGPHDPTDGFLY